MPKKKDPDDFFEKFKKFEKNFQSGKPVKKDNHPKKETSIPDNLQIISFNQMHWGSFILSALLMAATFYLTGLLETYFLIKELIFISISIIMIYHICQLDEHNHIQNEILFLTIIIAIACGYIFSFFLALILFANKESMDIPLFLLNITFSYSVAVTFMISMHLLWQKLKETNWIFLENIKKISMKSYIILIVTCLVILNRLLDVIFK